MVNEHGGDLPIQNADGSRSYPFLSCPHCPANFFKNDSYDAHQKERHSDLPQSVAWISGPHKISYFYKTMPRVPHFYLMEDAKSGKMLSNMALDEKGVLMGIETHPEHRRQGLATKLWREATEHSQDMPGIPRPQHSTMRTPEGDAWSRTLGAPPVEGHRLISSRQMRGMIDFERQ